MLREWFREITTSRHECREMSQSREMQTRIPSELDLLKDQAIQEILGLKARLISQDPNDRTYVGVRVVRKVERGYYTDIVGYRVIQRGHGGKSKTAVVSEYYQPFLKPA